MSNKQPSPSIFFERGSGILLHPTSLPSDYGIGDLSINAYRFIDFLERSGQKYWQVLPLNPPGYGESPYQCLSAFAGNPLLIDIDTLQEEGLIKKIDKVELPPFPEDKVEFDKVKEVKSVYFKKAFNEFENMPDCAEYVEFCREHGEWLEDYSLFAALKNYFGGLPWHRWEESAADRDENALNYYRVLLEREIKYQKFLQFKFFNQWKKLKFYANSKGIKIIGDLPIFVAHDSCDVWKFRDFFEVDQCGNLIKAAGVPPDEFTETGQLWGNPLYKWNEMEKGDYRWWKDRIKYLLEIVDIIRIDHFRGFEAYWEIPSCEKTAVNGRWVKGPGEKFFESLKRELGNIPLIVEDLGFITKEVKDLKAKLGFPGISVMQFDIVDEEFDEPLYEKNCVVYTGTHDNDTILGWYKKNAGICPVPSASDSEICWYFIEKAFRSDAEIVIIPLQDVLCLGSEARMNIPGTVGGNWVWRFSKRDLTHKIEERLKELARKYNR